jgi:hypothetical protein
MKKFIAKPVFILLASVSVATWGASNGKPLELGPFRTGMSFDAARAAAPGLAWRDFTVSKYTGKVMSIAAPDAITLGGLSHAIELRPGYYDSYSIFIKHVESVADASACEQLSVPVLAELEQRFGAFNPPAGYADQPAKSKDPGPPRFELVKAGEHSTISFTTNEDRDEKPRTSNPEWRQGVAEHDDGDYSVRFESAYTSDEFSSPFCKLVTLLDHHPPAPPWETLPFDASLFVRQPSIAVKHMSLEGVTLAKPTVAVDFACGVDRHSGMLGCSPKAAAHANESVVAAALRRTLAMQVDTARLDPDNPFPVRMDLTVELAQNEHRPIDFLGAPRVSMSDLVWTEQPTAQETQAAYPKSMLEQGVGAKVGLTCQVQSDLSLLCAVTDPKPQGDAKAAEDYDKLAFASVAVMSLYRAAPALKSGAPSAGAVIDTRVNFTPIN